jgi:hypothetical protein
VRTGQSRPLAEILDEAIEHALAGVALGEG